MGIADYDLAAAHVLDLPGGVSQQEDVSGIALDGEILVERADHGSMLILGHDTIVGDIRNGAAAGNRRQPCILARLELAVDAVTVQISAVSPTRRRDPFTEHLDYIVVV